MAVPKKAQMQSAFMNDSQDDVVRLFRGEFNQVSFVLDTAGINMSLYSGWSRDSVGLIVSTGAAATLLQEMMPSGVSWEIDRIDYYVKPASVSPMLLSVVETSSAGVGVTVGGSTATEGGPTTSYVTKTVNPAHVMVAGNSYTMRVVSGQAGDEFGGAKIYLSRS